MTKDDEWVTKEKELLISNKQQLTQIQLYLILNLHKINQRSHTSYGVK